MISIIYFKQFGYVSPFKPYTMFSLVSSHFHLINISCFVFKFFVFIQLQ